MENKICTQCGYKNNQSANFCKSCGTALSEIEKSAEQKAEEVKQKFKETANDVKQTSKDSVATFFILLRPILKVKIILPIVMILLSVLFWNDIVDVYDDYKYEQKIAKEKKERDIRLAKEKKERDIRLAKEKKDREIRLAKEKKEREERLAKEKRERLTIAKKYNLSSYPIGTFYDIDTKLMWQDNYEAKSVKKNWSDSKEYCSNLTFGGYNDWRLPSQNTLKDLYSKKYKLVNINSGRYWSSTTKYTSNAWIVDFHNGYTGNFINTSSRYVRCARLGQ